MNDSHILPLKNRDFFSEKILIFFGVESCSDRRFIKYILPRKFMEKIYSLLPLMDNA